jgi:hypothetical protein
VHAEGLIKLPVLTICEDIVKVRLQTTNQYSSALDAATKIWKTEGPLAFYKGTLTPLIGIGACVGSSSLFVYHQKVGI